MISFRWKENEILTFDERITTIISRRIHNYDNQTKYFIARVVATVRRGERETKKCEVMGLNVKRQHADVFCVHTWTVPVACRTSQLIVMRNPEDGREMQMTSMEKFSPRLVSPSYLLTSETEEFDKRIDVLESESYQKLNVRRTRLFYWKTHSSLRWKARTLESVSFPLINGFLRMFWRWTNERALSQQANQTSL